MAATYKVLGQLAPSATTESTLYTVTTGKSAVVSTLVICNQAAVSATYRIAVRPAADATTVTKHWIVYGATVAASDSTALTMGITLASGDVIRVWASSATLSFSAFGSEIV
jgi:hypothetical protein